MQRVKIAVDAMGGDFAPKNEVWGMKNIFDNPNFSDLDIVFVGEKDKISKFAEEANLPKDRYYIEHSDKVIEFTDNPTEAYKTKKDASMPKGFALVKAGEVHGFVSGGNTGAMLTGAVLVLGRIKGVKRPAIGTWLPASNERGRSFTLDVGATVDMNARFLYEYAVMGSTFVKLTAGVENPTVGLLNVGSEDNKGPETIKESFNMLKESSLNFYGNVEGGDILAGTTDVIVCDGYTGNILLKFAEGFPKLLKHLMRGYADKSLGNKLKAGMSKGVLKDSLRGLDYEAHGGVPVLGCNGIAIVCHGKSSPLAYENAIINAYNLHKSGFLTSIKELLN